MWTSSSASHEKTANCFYDARYSYLNDVRTKTSANPAAGGNVRVPANVRVQSFVLLTNTDKLLLNGLLPTDAGAERLRQLISYRSEIDWPEAVRRADVHSVASLLRFNLAQSGLLESVPAEQREQLRTVSQIWAARHLAYANEAAQLILALKAECITAIPLKGAALMLGGYYPQAGLRAALDIDLLVEPEKLDQADRVVAALGYEHLPGKRSARPRQRLANDINHLWPRRGTNGLILELHHRAFQFARRERDFSFDEVRSRAVTVSISGNELLIPSPADLAFHLVHHTLVDLQTTKAILRTAADLYFIFARESEAREAMIRQATDFGFGGAAMLADQLVKLLADGSMEELGKAVSDNRMALLMETALTEETQGLIDAARLFEYFDFRRHPFAKLGNLISMLFTSREHLVQIYGQTQKGGVYWNYLRRPFDLIRKISPTGISPANLRRVWKLRRATENKP